MIGERFGRWTVIGASDPHTVPCGHVFKKWRCRCECGVEKAVFQNILRNGRSKSCGCFSVDTARALFLKHGKCGTTEYTAWENMIQRCHNPNHPSYDYYGGRGIDVCKEWRESFTAFLNHIGPRLQEELEIDRTDNNQGYKPGNVRWVTHRVNMGNTRKSRRSEACH